MPLPVLSVTQRQYDKKGRHPALKIGSDILAVYQYIKGRAGYTTAEQIVDGLSMHKTAVRGHLLKLFNEGLIVKGEKTVSSEGRPVDQFRVVKANETGVARDKILVRIAVKVNDHGEYSADAVIVGQLATATEDNPRVIHTHDQLIAVPKPTESFATRQVFDKDLRVKTATVSQKSVIIDLDLEAKDITPKG